MKRVMTEERASAKANNIVIWEIPREESWEDVIKNKTVNGSDLSISCKLCLKYQVKVIYYDDCKKITL